MRPSSLNRWSWTFSPMAIGTYLTFIMVWLALSYYISKSSHREDANVLVRLLSVAHQKSIDFRLQSRGPKPPSEKVGLLVVDEKAVSTVGRWPWPREVTARAVARAAELGAKVIAFDVVFSESSRQPLREALQDLRPKLNRSPEILLTLQKKAEEQDSDLRFAQILAPHAQKLVYGSFAEGLLPATPGTYDLCRDLIFGFQPAARLWREREATPLIVLDSQSPALPDPLIDLYRGHLQQLSESALKELPSASTHDRYLKSQQVMSRYCSRWLTGEDELAEALSSSWQEVLAAVGGANSDFARANPTYADWAQSLTQKNPMNGISQFDTWTIDVPEIHAKQDNTNTGYFNAFLDSDGAIRKSALVIRTGNTYMPSIALKAYLLSFGGNAQIELGVNPKTNRKEIQRLSILNDEGEMLQSVPVDGGGNLLINYAGPRHMYPHVSLADLLDDRPEFSYLQQTYDSQKNEWRLREKTADKATFFKDKVFILGATAVGIFDLRVTPFDENFPGAETHANVLDNLLSQSYLRHHPSEEVWMLATVLILGLALSYGLSALGAAASLLITAGLMVGIGAIDRFLLFGNGYVVTIIIPLLLVLGLFIVLVSYRYLTEERGKKELRSTFQKYVSPAIVEEILADPSNLELGGRKARLTVFFSDLRGFTTISENLDPKALSNFLNSYLTPMTDIVFKNRGTLDKYMGDAIMAFFGAPIAYSDHALNACRCALASVAKLDELRREFSRKGLPEIDLGIGLNTGEVSVGNMGSVTVRNYTVMGDAVNLASRLEGINKEYGTRIIISEFTYLEVKDQLICREVDWVRVKGKLKPVRIFELLGEGQLAEDQNQHLKHYQLGFSLYHERRWAEAIKSFEHALNHRPSDQVTQLYLRRCQDYLVTPPGPTWDGVYTMKTK